MKRVLSTFMTILMIVSLMSMGSAFAKENTETIPNTSITPRASAQKTITDRDGNQYLLTGTPTIGGYYQGSVRTDFKVSLYKLGTPEAKKTVNEYTKALTAKGTVTMNNGAINAVDLDVSGGKTGESNFISDTQTFIYRVLSITSTHTFACNGGSGNITAEVVTSVPATIQEENS